jgi:hypothetical protein
MAEMAPGHLFVDEVTGAAEAQAFARFVAAMREKLGAAAVG